MKFDTNELGRALGIDPQPDASSREGRVRLLVEAFEALRDGRLPSRQAALFVASGGLAWLAEGGNLCRDYWRVSAPAGSHHTEAMIWRAMQEGSSRGAQGHCNPDRLRGSKSKKRRP